jgi:hypothetical protein
MKSLDIMDCIFNFLIPLEFSLAEGTTGSRFILKFDFQTSRQKLGKNKKQIPKLFNGKRIRNIAILQYLELMFEQKFTSI